MDHNFQIVNQTVKKAFLFLMLSFVLTFIGSFVYFVLLSRIGYFIASGLYINFWISLIIYSYFIINALYAILINFRFILVLFRKIKTVDHEVSEIDEPQLYALVKEITNELNQDYFPKIYIKDQTEIEFEYENQFVSIFKPQKYHLIIGLSLFQCLSREEFKAYLKHEIAKFSNPNYIKVQRYNALIFSCHEMFLRVEDVDHKKFTRPKLSPKSFFFLAYTYFFLAETLMIELFKHVRNKTLILNEILATEENKTYTPTYINAIYKLDEYYRVHSFTKEFALDQYHHQFNITNVHGFTQNVLRREDIKQKLLANYTNYLEQTKIDASHFEDNIKNFLRIKSIKNQYDSTIYLKNEENFNLNGSYLYGFKNHHKEGQLASQALLLNHFKSFQKAKQFPRFFDTLCKYITLDFETLSSTYSSEEVILRKSYLFDDERLDLIEESHVLCRDLELIHTLKNDHFKTIIYNQQTYKTPNEINSLIDELITLHHHNLNEINSYLDELYVYFKTFQVEDSKALIHEIVAHNIRFEEFHLLTDEIEFIKAGIYTEVNDTLVQDFINRFEEKFIPVKKSLQENLTHEILNELYTEEILETIEVLITSKIPLYENGIYFKEGFETMMKLNTWNLVILQDLIHLYTKKYLELNIKLYT